MYYPCHNGIVVNRHRYNESIFYPYGLLTQAEVLLLNIGWNDHGSYLYQVYVDSSDPFVDAPEAIVFISLP